MSQWSWWSENKGPREEVQREDEEMFQRLTLKEPARRKVLKERNPWLTPTESCESYEAEVEEALNSTPHLARVTQANHFSRVAQDCIVCVIF